MDAVVPLEFARGLDALPRGGYFDQDAFLGDPERGIQCNELFRLRGWGDYFLQQR